MIKCIGFAFWWLAVCWPLFPFVYTYLTFYHHFCPKEIPKTKRKKRCISLIRLVKDSKHIYNITIVCHGIAISGLSKSNVHVLHWWSNNFVAKKIIVKKKTKIKMSIVWSNEVFEHERFVCRLNLISYGLLAACCTYYFIPCFK